MAEFSKLITTKKGHALIAKMLAGTATDIDFTTISSSSAQYALTELEDLEALSDIQQTSLISNKKITNRVAIQLETSFTNTALTVGYYMRTLGLYATDPDEGEILFAVCIETTGNCWMPPYNGITVSGAYITLITTVGNSDNVSLIVDQAAIATIGNILDLKAAMDEHAAHSIYESEGIHGLRVNNGVLQYKNDSGEWIDISGGGIDENVVSEETIQEMVDGTYVPGVDPEDSDIASEEDIDGIIENIYPDD